MTTRSDLYALFKPFFPTITVIWQDENAPRPTLPYVAIKVMSWRFKNYDHYGDPDANGIQTVDGDREFTFNIQYLGTSPVDNLQTVVDKLRLQTTIDRFMAAKYVVFNTEQVVDVSALLDKNQFEPRATLDLFLRKKSYQTDDVGLIDTSNIAPTYQGSDAPTSPIVIP